MGKGPQDAEAGAKPTLQQKFVRELISWFWVILAFLFIHGTIVQARVIPSGSMENTLLVGDHLLVTRFGYDAQVPFTGWHWTLWRNPKRQDVVIFRRPGQPDFVKRVIGLPGDTVEIRHGRVWVSGQPLEEPYLREPHDPDDRFGPVTVPAGHYFVMGDNRDNSHDSRYIGFVSREDIIGTALIIYLSVQAPADAWQPGHLWERMDAYLGALVRPRRVRWSRLLTTF